MTDRMLYLADDRHRAALPVSASPLVVALPARGLRHHLGARESWG